VCQKKEGRQNKINITEKFHTCMLLGEGKSEAGGRPPSDILNTDTDIAVFVGC
jgi:hypothetical protein